jgi:undecaprenyl-diphosphatase
MMLSWIIQLDLRFSDYLHRHRFSAHTEQFFKFYTRLGDGYIWLLIFLYLLWTRGVAEMFSGISGILWQALASTGVSLALYWLIKLKVKRKRPFAVIESVEAGVPPLDLYSFPSGHTMNNLAAGFTVFYCVPSVGWIILLMALSWGFLRIYFGVHWLSDVVGGFILGFFSFLIAHFIWVQLIPWFR